MNQDTRLTSLSSIRERSLAKELSTSTLNAFRSDNEGLVYYLNLVLRRKWLVLSVVLIATTSTALYALSLPSIYQAEVTLRFEPKQSMFRQDGNTAFYSYENYEHANTQIKLLSNPQLLRRVTLRLNLLQDQGFLANRGTGLLARIRRLWSRAEQETHPATFPLESSVNADPESLTPRQMAYLGPYVSYILSALSVDPQENTNLVTLRFSHPNPETALNVVETLAREFIENDYKYETSDSEAALDKIARQVAQVQQTIRDQEQKRLEYLKRHDLPLGEGQGRNITTERLATLSSQLLAAERERKVLEAVYNSARSAKDIMSIPQVRDSEAIQAMRKVTSELEQKRAALLEIYTTNWPEVKRIDAELKQTRDNMNARANESISALESNFRAAVDSESKLREAYLKEQRAANGQSQDEIELVSLNQQIETNKQIYNTLFQRQKEREIDAGNKSNHVTVATPAALPLEPIGPPRLSKVAVAFFLSLALGVSLSILSAQFESGIKSAEDVTNYTYLPTLALIPEAKSGSAFVKRLLPRRHAKITAPSFITDLRSPSAEAYRQLRTSLLFNWTGQTPKTILVTSGSPLDGKTTTAINVAVTFAQAGADVLLIDCDLRRPRVHSQLHLPNGKGFTDSLGEEDFDSILCSYGELKVITAGSLPPNPADFLGLSQTGRLLGNLKERFSHIIIDSPPALAFADAAILSTLVDGVIIVAHAERTSWPVVKRVKERLQEVGATIYGVVLNCSNPKADKYYSAYYYSGYSAEEKEN